MRDIGERSIGPGADERLTQAKGLLKAGQLDRARLLAVDVLQAPATTPTDLAEASNLVGVVDVQLGNYQSGLEAFARAIDHAPAQAARYQYNRALAFERLGQMGDTVAAYQQVLDLAPDHAGARLRLAKALLATDRAGEALTTLEAGSAVLAGQPEVAYLSGLATLQLGKPAEALNWLDAFLRRSADHVEARLAAANALNRLKRPQDALDHLSRVLELAPDNIEARYLAGVIEDKFGRHEAAVAHLQHCVGDEQRGEPAKLRLIRLLRRLKRYDEAIALARDLHGRHPRSTQLIDMLGEALAQAKRLDELEAFADTVLANERRPHIWNMLAIHLKSAGRRDVAIKHWREAARLFPAVAQIAYNGGHALNERGDSEEGELHLRRAIALDGRYAKAWNSLGVALSIQHRYAEAMLVLRTAEALDPEMATVWLNYGIAVRAQDNYDEAIRSFRKAIKIIESKKRASPPDEKQQNSLALAHQNLAYTLLFVGEIEQGFTEYQWRWSVAEFPSTKRLYRQPVWDGQPLPKHGLVVWTEQGMGDEVMFSWHLPHVRADVHRLIVDCDKRLIPTFARSFPGVEFIARDEKNLHPSTQEPDIRFKAPAGHLPKFYFVATHKAIRDTWHFADRPYVRTEGYLKPDPARQEHWRSLLRARAGNRLTVGISWRSALHTRMRDMQYLKPEELALALGYDCAVINMQYSSEEQEIATLAGLARERNYTFINPPDIDLKNDLDDLFALVSVVDLVVSPLISLPWMAGAVGTPCWVFRTNETSRIWQQLGTPYVPWAPSLRLFFRHPLENWSRPIARINAELKMLTERRNAGAA